MDSVSSLPLNQDPFSVFELENIKDALSLGHTLVSLSFPFTDFFNDAPSLFTEKGDIEADKEVAYMRGLI